ncbi:MAG: 4'-phosphopantetheinyl transferase superfamily protein [Chryseobacterium sp.]|uniref:4'-phosphopantetheinyl transferase family protein n=1 Tax=Chryseobacterium sp. TaxID=1871047 RepID=UPI0025C1E74D|nr:4'-phosphopantetheinyl transferase superfamily protein [Chryseobacterium sp.]MCJ7933995.1 4'-phosphopantetheinyl transferase superfamily protein [Chryseobacterium sp.]
MVVLYAYIDEGRHQDLLDRYLDVFSGDFKAQILKFKRWQDAQLSLLGRILLKKGLSSYYHIDEISMGRLPNHKPFLKGDPAHFNISHSKNLVVCAIADFPIGIDVEFSDETVNYMDFQFQMTADECIEIDHSEDKIRSFFTYWTHKEAVIKAHGGGMMIPLDSFEVINNECIVEGKKFFTKDLFLDKRYHISVASENREIQHREIIFEPFNVD